MNLMSDFDTSLTSGYVYALSLGMIFGAMKSDL